MSRYQVHVRRPADVDVAAVTELLRAASGADGLEPLSEQKWLDLVHAGRRRSSGLEARDPGGRLAGYGQLAAGQDAWAVESAVHPEHRRSSPDGGVARALLEAAVDQVAAAGGGRLRYWVSSPAAHHDEVAEAMGFVAERELWQMRVPLPLDGAARGAAPAVDLRPFRPGRDEAAWLAVNNRAFADHPEQGGWDLDTLVEHEAQPWFDPEGFLLHWVDGRLGASCWTKVHAGTEPPMGEIYVISVDPDRHGQGLGRALTVAGLEWLAGRGLGVGMLYVDAANEPAVGLYRSLGFAVHHADRAYLVEVPAAAR